jgi:hypothetical protein
VNDDEPGHLIVHKVTNPSSDTTTVFSITPTGGVVMGTSTQPITGGGTVDYTVHAGTYDVSETPVAGWSEDVSACQDIVVPLGGTSECTITNTKLGTITIVKDAQPNDLSDFAFSGTLGSFSLDDDSGVVGEDNVLSNSTTTTNLSPGSYTINETQPNSFWTLEDISCVSTGTTDPYTDITETSTGVTVNIGAGSDVTCTFVNEKASPTRTQGFWQTHTTYTSGVFSTNFAGGMNIGSGIHKGLITNIQSVGQSQLFGAYFSNISQKTTGKGAAAKRTAIDQARMQLLQQLVTAKLNCAAFGCTSSVQAMIATADTAYATGTVADILASAGALDAYNNSGDTAVIGNAGSATPKTSQSYANKAFWDTP